MTQILITPKDDFKKIKPKIKNGDTLIFTDGEYPGGIYLTDKNEITVELQGASFVGGRGLKFERCNELIFRGWGEIRNSEQSGLMVVNSVGLDVISPMSPDVLEFHSNKKSGILTGNVSQVNIAGIKGNGNGEHGIYLSQSGDDYNITNNYCFGNLRCGIQVNANQPRRRKTDQRQDAVSRRVYIKLNTLEANQQQYGAAAINLAGVQRGEIRDNTIKRHRGRHGIALWDDGKRDPQYACHDIDIDYNLIELIPELAKAGIDIGKGCSRIKVGTYNTFKGIAQKIWVVSHG